MITSAVPEMATEGDIERVIKKRERGALVLHARIETPSRFLQGVGNINRPARKDAAILYGEGEYFVTRTVCPLDGCIEINGLRRGIDHRRAGDAKRIDIPARQ